MESIEGKFLRQVGGKGFVARVIVEVEAKTSNPSINVAISGKGPTKHGDPEDASVEFYGDWVLGAKYGAAYALRIAERADCSVTIHKITGASTDTNPTVVAAATTDAVWKSLHYTPAESIRRAIETTVLRSWEAGPRSVLPFDEVNA